MPKERQSKYFWPAAAITESDMDLLYRARESSPVRIPITQLIARAVRETYGQLANAPVEMSGPAEERRVA